MTDIQGSTEAWQAAPTEMPSMVARHYELMAAAIADHGGHRPLEQGEGDSVVAVFPNPTEAVAAAIQAQQTLQGELPDLPVRMALHTGEAAFRDENNYAGLTIIRCARIRNCGHGGQILLSDETRVAADPGAYASELVDLGVYALRGLSGRTRIWQLLRDDLPATFPPLRAGVGASVAWTYDSLAPAEQQILRRLSIFAGSIDFDAATSIAAAAADGETAAMAVIDKLVDQQLLEVDSESNRLAMVADLVDLCRGRLAESPDFDEVQLQHVLWFAQVAERFDGSAPDSDLAKVDRDKNDIMAAIQAAMELDDPTAAYRLINGIGRHWDKLDDPGLVAEIARWLINRTPSDGEQLWAAAVARISYAVRNDRSATIHDFTDEARAITEMVSDDVSQEFVHYNNIASDESRTATAQVGTKA